MIQFIANGVSYERSESVSVSLFINDIGLPNKSVIVEYNRDFLPIKDFEKTMIKDGDSLEIIRAFAGG